jgi:exodeoxyribonuclease V gamma subunit
MLEALLSARRALYISWTGHHVRDNSEQPPSVLVSQLQDYLASGWQGEGGQPLLAQRTQQHPLQPFSRRYFEEGSPWTTYAREWRAAHAQADGDDRDDGASGLPALPGRPPFVPDASAPLTLARLTDFLRHPARAYLRQRLQVRFEQEDNPVVVEELFQLDGLTEYLLVQQLQQQVAAGLDEPEQAPQAMEDSVRAAVARLTRSGRLPLAGLGARGARALQASVTPSLRAWHQQLALYAQPAARRRLLIEHGGLVFDDWMDGLRAGDGAQGELCWLLLEPRKLLGSKGLPRADRLMPFYLRSLALAASGAQAQLRVVARDGLVLALPMAQQAASERLRELMALWREGQDGPLPLPLRTGIAMAEGFPDAARQAYEGGHLVRGEGEDPSWARCYPDFEALEAGGRFAVLALDAHAPLLDWVAAQVQVLPYQGDAP